jgi:hypothetical protein
MIEIIKSGKEDRKYKVFLNGRLFSEKAFRNKAGNYIHIDGYPELDIKEIAEMPAADFPDGFHLKFTSPYVYEGIYDLFDIQRNGSLITIVVYGSIDRQNIDWLIWNPLKYEIEANNIALKKGYRISEYAGLPDNEALLFEMDFKVQSTIGELFEKALAQSVEIMKEAHEALLKQVLLNT